MAESLLQQRIKELAAHHGSMRVLGRVLMVDHAYLHRLSTGEKDDPGPELLRKLKLRRIVTYERTDGAGGRVKPGDCVHCGKEICNDLGWCNSFKAAPAPACACGDVERQGWVHRPDYCWPYDEAASGVNLVHHQSSCTNPPMVDGESSKEEGKE